MDYVYGCYKTSDGALFEQREAALEHEFKVDVHFIFEMLYVHAPEQRQKLTEALRRTADYLARLPRPPLNDDDIPF